MLLGTILPCLALALLSLGYAAGWHEGYRRAWLVMVPKPDPKPAPTTMLVPNRGTRPLSPDFVASLQRVMAKNAKKDLN